MEVDGHAPWAGPAVDVQPHLEGVAVSRGEAWAVVFDSGGGAGQQVGEVADAPGVVRALGLWQIDVIQGEPPAGSSYALNSFKHHPELSSTVEGHMVQFPWVLHPTCTTWENKIKENI